jgi:flagellar hook-associated protein 2
MRKRLSVSQGVSNMSGTFTAGGLITGMDSNMIISQLMQLERQPIFRLEDRIMAMRGEQEAILGVRTQLTTFRNITQDFRLQNLFDVYEPTSSEESVMTAKISSSSPTTGAFNVDVTRLATATIAQSSGVLGGSINPDATLSSNGMATVATAGTFSVNGVEFTVDPDTQTMNNVLSAINASAAGVTATYDAGSDSIVFENNTPGDTSVINFGGSDDTGNFLSVIGVTQATQITNGSGSTEVTSTTHLGAVSTVDTLNALNFAGGAVTSESFTINGITISVDPTTDSLSDVIGRINTSDAGVSATYDSASDTIRVVSDTLGSRTINFGDGGTNNFLSVTNLAGAVQTAGQDSEFTIDGGAVQNRNTNEVTDAIGGVTLSFLSIGVSTITVSSDEDAILESVKGFIEEFNNSVSNIRTITGQEGELRGDAGISNIESFMRGKIFERVSGLGGTFQSLVDIGITTGEDFDSAASAQLHLNEEKFLEALRDDRDNVAGLFTNDNEDGIADQMFDYLDEATRATGFLNMRAKANGTMDQQIQILNDRIVRMEERLVVRENRMRRQFTVLEQMSANFQNQASALMGLGAGF